MAALTSSLTIVTLQLLSTQFTPRALRGFLRGRLSQVVVGALLGIFMYCLLVAVAVRDPGDLNRPFVPSLSVVVAILLALVGLVLLVGFIHHLVQTIQVSHLAATIAARTRRELRRDACAAADDAGCDSVSPGPDECSRPVVLRAGQPGYVRAIDPHRVAAAAPRPYDTVRLLVRAGDFVTTGAPIIEVRTPVEPTPRQLARLAAAVVVLEEREIPGDAAFGVRQLTDIALRAIAPGVNDPSTAVTCISYLQDILVTLATRPMPTVRTLRPGPVTVVAPVVGFDQYAAATLEIARYARDARVAAALLEALVAAAAAAEVAGRHEHTAVLRTYIGSVSEQAFVEARTELDRDMLTRLADRFPAPAVGVTPDSATGAATAHVPCVRTMPATGDSGTSATRPRDGVGEERGPR